MKTDKTIPVSWAFPCKGIGASVKGRFAVWSTVRAASGLQTALPTPLTLSRA